MKNLKDMRYDAFISYRHLEPDSFVAQTLHKSLEAFKLPRSARDKAVSGRAKIERIFRDEEELPLSEDLSEPINNALANSEYLICICTPRYLESKWCMREIETFLQTHDRDHILVVLAEGEPEDSFPALLTQGGREPLAADTRGEAKKEIVTKMNTAVLRISAAIFGLNYDDLKQRHREARLKHLMAVGGAIGVAVLAFAVFATVTLIRISHQNAEIFEQNREISRQKDTISAQYSDLQEKYTEKTVESAGQLLGKGRRDDAIRELLSVLPDEKDKPYNSNVVRLLYEALNIYRVNKKLAPVRIYEDDTEINTFDVSSDGKYILLQGDSKVRVYDCETNELINEIDSQSEDETSAFSAGFCGAEGFVVVDGANRTYYTCGEDAGGEITLPEEISDTTSFYQDPEDGVTLVSGADSLLAIGDKGAVRYRVDLADIFKKHDLTITGVSFGGKLAVATFMDSKYIYVVVFDRATGKPVYHCREEKDIYVAATVYGDTLCYVSSESSGQRDGVRIMAAAVDIRSGKKQWETELAGDNVIEVKRVGDNIYARGASSWTALSTSGELLSTVYTETAIDTTWAELTDKGENYYYYLCGSGDLYASNDDGSVVGSDRLFQYKPTQEVETAKHVGDVLYYMHSDYVVRYAPEISDKAEKIEEDYEEESFYTDPGLRENTEEIIASVEETSLRDNDEAFFSNDRRFLCVHSGNLAHIIDTAAGKLIRTLKVTAGECLGMRYSELAKGYIIDTWEGSLLLDRDFNIISEADRIVGEDEKGFIVRDDWFDYYRLPFISPEALEEELAEREKPKA